MEEKLNLKDMRSKETQYQDHVETFAQQGPAQMGYMTSNTWRTDPKRLGFLLARYKFVAKMLVGCEQVLEVGCGDGFGSTLVAQAGAHVTCTDFDPLFIEEAQNREGKDAKREFVVVDFLKNGLPGRLFDAAYFLDVIEHIEPKDEELFVANICKAIKKDGICIIGAPSLESQKYASPASKLGHINCKSGEDMRAGLKKHFQHVFMFSMNDEVVHTGFLPMANYLMALCVGPKHHG